LLGTLKKQTPGQAQCFTGSPLAYSLSCSAPEIVKCLERKEISGHLKCKECAKTTVPELLQQLAKPMK